MWMDGIWLIVISILQSILLYTVFYIDISARYTQKFYQPNFLSYQDKGILVGHDQV